MRNVSYKFVEKNETHLVFSNFFFFENHAAYEILLKNTADPDTPQKTTLRIRIACWIPVATNTHSEYVILIAFPPQKWLHERALLLRYT
jgi:hypothetical protein